MQLVKVPQVRRWLLTIASSSAIASAKESTLMRVPILGRPPEALALWAALWGATMPMPTRSRSRAACITST